MPALYVHLAPAAKIESYLNDDDPTHHWASAIADHGVWHKVQTFSNIPGTFETPEGREFHTACGITQIERPDRMEESEKEPGGARCPKCFGKGK